MKNMKNTLLFEKLQWYRRYYSLFGIMVLFFRKIIYRWLTRSKYLFIIDLAQNLQRYAPQKDLTVESFSTIDEIPKEDLERLMESMAPGRLKPFMNHFFGYGARLWIAKKNEEVVGIKWTLLGGFNGFFSMPIEKNDVVSLAEQVFEPFRGKGVWAKMTDAVLLKLKNEGVSRVYFGVHSRNASMLKAVEKAGYKMVGRVLTIRVLGYRISFWNERFLWGKLPK